MSAKDPRRALLLRLPDDLRPAMRRVRSGQRSSSTAASLRRLVEAGLRRSFDPEACPPEPAAGRVIRLQLPRAVRARLQSLAHAHRLTEQSVALGLVAAGAATVSQDAVHRGSLTSP